MLKHYNMSCCKHSESIGSSVFSNSQIKQAKANYDNYNRLIANAVKRLNKVIKATVYCTYKEQLNEIIAKCKFELVWEEMESGGFKIRRKNRKNTKK